METNFTSDKKPEARGISKTTQWRVAKLEALEGKINHTLRHKQLYGPTWLLFKIKTDPGHQNNTKHIPYYFFYLWVSDTFRLCCTFFSLIFITKHLIFKSFLLFSVIQFYTKILPVPSPWNNSQFIFYGLVAFHATDIPVCLIIQTSNDICIASSSKPL